MADLKIGLALGGGGARGLAHIPMLEAFDELGIKPAIIAGSSMGALVGAGYAAGMSGKDMRARAEFILNNRMDAMRYIFGTRKSRLGELLSLKGLTAVHIQGAKLADLALRDDLPHKIEDTKIPLRIVATDYQMMEEKVFDRGDMLTAVGASIAIPGVIAGAEIDGHFYVDGGVTNPVPFNHARDGMDIVIAIDVTSRPRDFRRAHPTNQELAVGAVLIMFNQIAELRRQAQPPDLYIRPDVANFHAADFFRVRELFEAAEPAKEQLKRAIEMRLGQKPDQPSPLIPPPKAQGKL
jgi:NTE family protein